jgi:peptide/nickel transport system permease protein
MSPFRTTASGWAQHRLGRLSRRLATLSRMQIFGLGSVCALLVLAVIGPLIAPYPTTTASPATRLLSPSLAHWLGTD